MEQREIRPSGKPVLIWKQESENNVNATNYELRSRLSRVLYVHLLYQGPIAELKIFVNL